MKSGIEPVVRTVRPGDFPLGSAKSRAMARALCQEKKRKWCMVQVVHFGRDRNLPPELVTSYTDADGQIWEVWEISYTHD